MKTSIRVVTKEIKTTLEHIDLEVELPTVEKYYSANDDGIFFARGLVLFAIIPRYKNSPANNYMIYEVESGNQKSTDFVPTKDCRSDYWLKESNTIRNTAFNIITGKKNYDLEFKEISKEDFLSKREELLSLRFTD